MSTFIKNFKWGHYEKDFKDSPKKKKKKEKGILAEFKRKVTSFDEISLDDFTIWHRAT